MTYFGNLYYIPFYEGQLDFYSISSELGFSSLVEPDPEFSSSYNEWVFFSFLGFLFYFCLAVFL
jgi:hypothetical protein